MKNFFVLLLMVIAHITYAQTPSLLKSPPLSESSAETQGLSPERLDRIDGMLKKAVADGEVPGVVALVARNGKIVFHEAYGMADTEAGRKLKKDGIFRIASQTKAITSTAVMMLWEEGKFQLDDPISKYIPEFKDPQVLVNFNEEDSTYITEPARSEITIRQLLTHTSGLGYGIIDKEEAMKIIYQQAGVTDLFTTEDISIKESVKKLAKLPLHHHPGEKYTYSEGLDVLGYFVEVISDMPFDQFLRKRLFDPLDMSDTWFYLPEKKAKRLVAVHYMENGAWKRFPVTFYDPDYPIKGSRQFFSGGAGLSSTAKDYATFLQMYLNGGELNGTRFLSRTTVQSIMGNQIGELKGDVDQYGLAFGLLTEKGQHMGGKGSEGTFSWGGYFNTQYFADPKENLIGIIMKQTQGKVADQTGWRFPLLVNQAVDD